MEAIWKVQLSLVHIQQVSLPAGSEVLCVQMQNGIPCIWFICLDTDPDFAKETRTFIIYQTGGEHYKIEGEYIGTFQLKNGGLVFHVFEEED